MNTIRMDFTISLDGFMTGPNVSVSDPMGKGDLRLHEWILADQLSDADTRVSREAASSVELEQVEIITSPRVTHLHYRVVK